ncbi:MAG: restriction endonuclease subunit R [Opitutales bacterium]
MIVDEAHNAVTGLTRDVQTRIRPAAIVEFTATPRGRNNILHSVTATALKDEEMIKLPIRVRPHDDWREVVHATCATRNMLEEKAKGDEEHIRPIALYQAQARDGHPTVAELKAYLIENALAREEWIKVATGEQRELDGVNLADPAEQTRHVITVQALREGWDCPSAYVLCATQRLSNTTAVEQLLGRVLRMPYAARRADPALNVAYAHVSEPSFSEAAERLRDKLIDMGFTDEEVRESLRPRGVEKDAQGNLFDPDPVAPKAVLQFTVPDTEEGRSRLNAMQDEGVDYIPQDDGTLKVGVRGAVAETVVAAAEELVAPEERVALRAAVEKHRAKVEAALSPADKGAIIEVPLLLVQMGEETFVADTDAIMERTAWSLSKHAARLTEEELAFRREESVIEIDLKGDKLVYSQATRSQPILRGMSAPPDEALEATLVQWLTRECLSREFTEEGLRTWIAGVVADLLTRRDIHVRTLVDWQHQIAAKLRWKLGEIRTFERQQARQRSLFDPEVLLTPDPAHVIRFDASVYRTVPTQPTGAVRLNRHLLGTDRVPLIDGNLGGEEFQCAVALDSLEEVEVWVRNVARHPDSFWLPRLIGRYYPDFIARLTDGRIFVVEYKGEHLVGGPEAKEKRLLGELWARSSGNLFVMVERVRHGLGPTDQLRAAIER